MELKDRYIEVLKSLLPKGFAWTRGISSTFYKLFDAMAEEMARFDLRVGTDLINEADPRTSFELLTDWEALVGLPDDCQTSLGVTVAQRRLDIIRKLTSRGGQSRQFFIDLAAAFGYTVTVTQALPFRAGKSRCGDRCYDVDWWYHWFVSADSAISTYFLSGVGRAGDPLRTWTNTTLECVIREVKPAHSVVHFIYGSS